MSNLSVELLPYDKLEREYEDDVAVAEGDIEIQIEDDLRIGETSKRFTVTALCRVFLVEDTDDKSWRLSSMSVSRYDFKCFDKDNTEITADEESILISHLDSTYEEQYHQLEILVQEDVRL